MGSDINVGIVGTGIYLPEQLMTAKEISEATKGYWSEEAVREKLGINSKRIPGPGDGTQEMGVKAGLDALERTGIDPAEIDLVLCMGKSGRNIPHYIRDYIQEKIGARMPGPSTFSKDAAPL